MNRLAKVPEDERLIRSPEALLTLLLEACYAWSETAPPPKGNLAHKRHDHDVQAVGDFEVIHFFQSLIILLRNTTIDYIQV